MNLPTLRIKVLARVLALTAVSVVFGYGHAESKPRPLELASAFHPADPVFGNQLQDFFAIVEMPENENLRFHRTRKTRGSSPTQIVGMLSIGSVDGVLLDPIRLGYRPPIAQIFGGIPFGPTASQIVKWSESTAGREQIINGFQRIGAYPLLCGHADSASGVFARKEFAWPVPAHRLTIHTRGLADDVYQGLSILTRPLPGADLYMGYATGVVDLLVSLNLPLDARAGFGQTSRYFYYPSWERRSAFALLLMNQTRWLSLTKANRNVIEKACLALNRRPIDFDVTDALATISKQGAGDTVVKPWPTPFLDAARQQWKASARKTIERLPSLAPAFRALKIPGVNVSE